VLAHGLVQRGWLTTYQAEQVLEGNAQQLNLGGYRILEPVATGGMGVIYKCRQQSLGRLVAVKVFRPQQESGPEASLRRFQREAQAVAQLQHPNIVTIHDVGRVRDTYYIVMEFVDGPDLAQVVRDRGPLPANEACELGRQAALGLQHAFEAGLVHRDIKPSNLLLAPALRQGSGTWRRTSEGHMVPARATGE